jgi:hypothetical protein
MFIVLIFFLSLTLSKRGIFFLPFGEVRRGFIVKLLL